MRVIYASDYIFSKFMQVLAYVHIFEWTKYDCFSKAEVKRFLEIFH